MKPAMTRGYSKIFLNERVIPSTNAYWGETGLDFAMMAMLAATERTEQSWEKLLTSVGLRIVKIWNYDRTAESLIEAELA